jgi:hypothetical protein
MRICLMTCCSSSWELINNYIIMYNYSKLLKKINVSSRSLLI